MKLGFIGLGIMGSRMAENLQKHGYELVVHNRTRSRADRLIANGAQWAETPAEVGHHAEILFTMLSAPPVVEQLALGDDGFLDTMKPGSTWVDTSTVNPAFSRRMAEKAGERWLHFVDAPVAGTKGPAERAELVFYAGGSETDVERVRPYLSAMGREIVHVGNTGMGASLKMVVNLLLGEAMLAFAEALTLGQSMGIDLQTLFQVLLGGPVVPAFLNGKRPKIEAGDYEAEFPLQWLHKDLHLAAITGYERGVPLPAANAAKETYSLAERAGLGEQDFSAIYAFLQSVRVPAK